MGSDVEVIPGVLELVAQMRAAGIVQLSVHPDGSPAGITLGPAPSVAVVAPRDRATQPDLSDPSVTEHGREHEQLRAQVAQRLRTQYAASGAVVTAEEISRELARVVAARAR